MVLKVSSVCNEVLFLNAGIGNTSLLEWVLSMLAFTGKYGTGCLYINNCRHGLERFSYLKLYNTMILVNAGMANKYSTFEYDIVHAGIYW